MDEAKEKLRRQSRQLRFMQVSSVTFLDILKNGEHHFKIADGVPDDAKFEFAGHTEWGTLNIVFSSREFQLVTEGDIIPEFLPPSFTKLRQITNETKGRFLSLTGSYLSHENRDIRNMAIMLRNFLQEG